jgi:hypothetical protein
MSAGTPFFFAPAKKKLLTGGFNLSSDALKACLTTNAQALSAQFLGSSGDARYADLSAEVASGSGYTTGGLSLSGVALQYYLASAAIAAPGTGGTIGTQTLTGTTGTGTKFQVSATVAGGAVTAIGSVTNVGAYSALPTSLLAEPVTGGGLTGAQLALSMGVDLTFANPTWSSATLTAKYLVIYDSTTTHQDLLAAVDLETTVGTGVSVTAGTLIYQVGALGLFQLN